MDALALDVLGGFHDRLGQRGVGVDGVHQLVYRALQLDGDARLVDQIGGVGADDVDAQDLAVLGIGDDLDQADVLVDREGRAAPQTLSNSGRTGATGVI